MNADLPDALPWLVLLALYGLPLLHVALSRHGGGWRPPAGSRCPFGPRTGWLVMVLMLGPVGWLMFALRRPRRVSGRRSGPCEAGLESTRKSTRRTKRPEHRASGSKRTML